MTGGPDAERKPEREQPELRLRRAGRNTGQTGPLGSTSYSYDVAGRRTQMNYGGGLVIDYDHLVTGEVTRVRENGATSGVGVLASYAYDDLGRRTGLTRGNGTAKSFGYDSASRLASISEDLAGTSGDLTLGFTYNPASQIATSTRSNDAYAWNAHYSSNARAHDVRSDGWPDGSPKE